MKRGPAVITVVVLLLVAGAWFGYSRESARGTPPVSDYSLAASLSLVAGGDVLAIVDHPTGGQLQKWAAEEIPGYGGLVQYWDVTVVELVLQAEIPFHRERGEDLTAPDVEAGQTLTVLEESLFDDRPKIDLSDIRPGERLVVVLGYLPLAYEVDHRLTRWHLQAAYAVSDDGSVRLLGEGADIRSELLAELKSVEGSKGSESDFDFLVAWTREGMTHVVRGERGPGRGEITAAYGRLPALLREQRERDDWYALPPQERSLDRTVAPPEVFETLVEKTIFTDVSALSSRDSNFLILRTSQGVLHVAHLSGGSHTAGFHAPPGEPIEVFVSPTPTPGPEGEELVATIDAATLWNSQDTPLLVVNLDTDGKYTALTSLLDESAVHELLQGWATD